MSERRQAEYVVPKYAQMPTVKRDGPYRFYFYSHEPNEPAHVHVDRETFSAKFWLNPVALARNFGFGPPELRRLLAIVKQNQPQFLEAWNEHFPHNRR
jgi:hypothetical protein